MVRVYLLFGFRQQHHLNGPEDPRLTPGADDAHRKLPARQKLFDQNRLAIGFQQAGASRFQLVPAPDD